MTPDEILESLPKKMAALELSNADLGRLVNWSSSQLSGFLKGQRRGMPIQEMNDVYFMVVELERLAKLLEPIPLDFGRTDSIRELINQYRRGQLSFYTSNEDTNCARFKIVIEAIGAAEREIQRAAAIGALIEAKFLET